VSTVASELHDATVLTLGGRLVRHRAEGDRTLCRIELGGSVPDPIGLEAADAMVCKVCRNVEQPEMRHRGWGRPRA
jgi:hypothetical protein